MAAKRGFGSFGSRRPSEASTKSKSFGGRDGSKSAKRKDWFGAERSSGSGKDWFGEKSMKSLRGGLRV